MREHCGDLLVEPNSLRQQPSTISSHCSSDHHHQTTNIQFSELNQLEVGRVGCKQAEVEEYNNLLNGGRESGGFGFTINEEEWSLFSKSHLADLEPYERKKMCSLPKSFTPFSSSTVGVGEGGLVECSDRNNLNRSASNSILLRKCESLNPTPSQFLGVNGSDTSEPNNNNIVAHPSSLGKMLLLHKSHEGFQEDEKENWLSDEGWEKQVVLGTTNSSDTSSAAKHDSASSVGEFGRERSLLWEGGGGYGQRSGYATPPQIAKNDNQTGTGGGSDVADLEFLPTARFPVSHHSSTFGGTIGSHPNPIISCAADQAHYHQHQDLSTTQQPAAFPSTVYNFHQVDPLLYAECYDVWNANNVASLCENSQNNAESETTPVLLADNLFSAQPQQRQLQVAPESGFGSYGAFGENEEVSARAVEEVNPLSTFLSKFDDKVAAIWGQPGSAARSSLGTNFLGVDGCISTASTPLGSSNPWGSPSSDVSTSHGGSDLRLMQHHNATQMSLAADALLAGGYGMQPQPHQHQLRHHDHFPEHQQSGKSHQQVNGTANNLTISPPKGNYNIMHSMKQYFGTAPPEGEYHIIKKSEATSSVEELQKSLTVLNHDQTNGNFVAYVGERKGAGIDASAGGDFNLKTMTKALDSIDLFEGDNDKEVDEEWEIVEACNRGKPHGCEGEDLLNSWKTHFRTIEQVETIANTRGIDLMESPVTTISAHQINHNLPEYRLFDVEIDGEYKVFQKAGQTIFPVKYKLYRQNEKGNQTEDSGVEEGSPPAEEFHYKMEWAKYLSVPPFEFNGGSLGNLPRSTTPVDSRTAGTSLAYESGENGADYQTLDWYNLSKGVEYNGIWGEWAVGDDSSQAVLPGGSGGDYCDSGVGGVGSRSDFYDDMFGDYEGDYDNLSGIGYTFPGGFAATETDTDYGQFGDMSGLAGACDTSSVFGKQGKSNKRNKARLRPCKYYFMEGSCRRGNDCKFSHDSVTCRYWAEGSCLKGQTCPYVHCFIDGKKLSSQDEYGLRSNGTEKQYHLESETDFPALSSTKNTMLSSRQPMSLGFSTSVGDGIRRLEDSLESLTVFTDSNSSVVDEEVTETRRLFLFERLRTSPPPPTPSSSSISGTRSGTTEKVTKKQFQNGDSKSSKSNGGHHKGGGSEGREWSQVGGGSNSSRSLSKSKSLGDTNSSCAPWSRHSVSRSNSHSSTTGMSLGIPVKEKRKKKKH